jgi:drug/metabolite transporter (DMT)-like permease
LAILFGISSALVWGAADFIGGLTSKRTSPFRVLYLAELAGLVPFLAAALLSAEPIPSASDLMWGALGSLVGLSGLVMLYSALAAGQMSIAAPVSALLAAVLPVLFGLFTIGLPSASTFVAFGLAMPAIWLISKGSGQGGWRLHLANLRRPLLAGILFGLYFILIHSATVHAFFWPLVMARLTGFIALGAYALVRRQPALPPRDLWRLCLANGILDVGGNAFFVLAARSGRMDVAAVLGSLYPASTVGLAWILLREKITRPQLAGIIMAFAAIVLFAI